MIEISISELQFIRDVLREIDIADKDMCIYNLEALEALEMVEALLP